MPTPRRLTRSAVLLALLALPTAASAQRIADAPPAHQDLTLFDRYRLTNARLMIEFWTPRLNEYREEIDRMLSATDLIELNELRARASLLLERMKSYSEETRREQESYTVDTTTVMTAQTAEYATTDTTTMVSDGSEGSIDYAAIEREREMEYERMRAEEHQREVRLLEQILAGDERAAGSLATGSEWRERSARSNARFMIREELAELQYVAQWIGRNYRSAMDQILERFIVDYEEFQKALTVSTREFYQTHRAAVVQDQETVTSMLGAVRQDEDLRRVLIAGIGREATQIRSAFEALLFAYSGQDLRELMTIDQLPLSNRIADMIPPAGALGQNSPNPASARTAIPYTVTEAGTQVVLRVLDTRGVVVATFDQGSRDAGDHIASVDVTTLPTGTYIYQLSARTPSGERTYSKSMTVEK